MDQFLSFAVSLHGLWAYFAIFIAMFVDANVTVLLFFLLMGINGFNFRLIFLAIVSGALFEQLMWYSLGLHLGKRDLIAAWADRVVSKYDSHLQEKTFHTVIISKFAFGVHRAVLVRCGMLGIPFSRLLKAVVPATFFWLVIIGGLGYAFGSSYRALDDYVQYAGIFLLFIVVVFFAVQYVLSKKLRRKL